MNGRARATRSWGGSFNSSGKVKTDIRGLLTYPEDSVGRLMTTDFLSFHKDMSAQEAIEKIRRLGPRSTSRRPTSTRATTTTTSSGR